VELADPLRCQLARQGAGVMRDLPGVLRSEDRQHRAILVEKSTKSDLSGRLAYESPMVQSGSMTRRSLLDDRECWSAGVVGDAHPVEMI
jgi:hypothetical protein